MGVEKLYQRCICRYRKPFTSSMGQGFGPLFALVSVAALSLIVFVVVRTAAGREPLLVVALGLISGGIVGNLYDRLGLPGLTWHAPFERQGSRTVADRFRGEDYRGMKFPSGIVERQHSIGLQFLWEPLRGPHLNVSLHRPFTRKQDSSAQESELSITAGYLLDPRF